MDMSKENSVGDSRAVYTPPCVVKISDLKQGAGAGCMSNGSGDFGNCHANGIGASGTYGCDANGNSASGGTGGISCHALGNAGNVA